MFLNYLKRYTVCLPGHKWARIPYPKSPEDEPTGFFLRCLRCQKENHNAGTLARGGGGIIV